MRADAAERRTRLLAQARRLFAEHGSDISLDAIADASEVGIATLYRNFPSREALVVAVVLDTLADIDAVVGEANALLPGGTEQAWERLLSGLVHLNLGALTAALGSHFGAQLPTKIVRAQQSSLAGLDGTLGQLAARRAVRADLSALQLVVAIGTITRPQPAAIHAAAPALVEQLLEAFDLWRRP